MFFFLNKDFKKCRQKPLTHLVVAMERGTTVLAKLEMDCCKNKVQRHASLLKWEQNNIHCSYVYVVLIHSHDRLLDYHALHLDSHTK